MNEHVAFIQYLQERYKGRGHVTLQVHERQALLRAWIATKTPWETNTLRALVDGRAVESNAFINALLWNLDSLRSQVALEVSQRLTQ